MQFVLPALGIFAGAVFAAYGLYGIINDAWVNWRFGAAHPDFGPATFHAHSLMVAGGAAMAFFASRALL